MAKVGAAMEEQIRILQVLGRLDRGGAETMIMNLYRHIDRSRFQFDFVIHTQDVCDYTEEVSRLGGRIYSMEPFRMRTLFSYRRQWRRFFREHPEYRIIHGHVRSTAALYLSEAKKAGLVTIVHSHNTSSGRGFSALVKNILQYPLRFLADELLACSKRAGIWLYGKRACQSSHFYILKNGIEPEAFRFSENVRNQMRIAMAKESDRQKALVFLHIGRMEEQKNHTFLLQIFAAILRKNAAVQLWLCGEGPLAQRLKEQAQAAGIADRVHFLGIREDIPALMAAADAVVFPSLFEGLPVTLVEAQAAGLPILMSDVVTDEVVITDLVQTLPLSASEEKWADMALQMLSTVRMRESYAKQVAQAGYAVSDNAKWLTAFYENLLLRK